MKTIPFVSLKVEGMYFARSSKTDDYTNEPMLGCENALVRFNRSVVRAQTHEWKIAC